MTLNNAIQTRFAAPAWAVFFEVGNSTGFQCSRRADAVAMSIWPSRGLEIIGIECKASRGDWIKELKTPEKSDEVMQYCDRWYLAVTNGSIVQGSELPETWGLFTLRGDRLIETKAAPKLTPAPLDRSFVAAMLRRAAEYAPAKTDMEAAEAKARKEAEKICAHSKKHLEVEFQSLKDAINEFQRKSGITIRTYNRNEDFCNAAQALVRLKKISFSKGFLSSYSRQLRERADDMETLCSYIDKTSQEVHDAVSKATDSVERAKP